MAAIHRPIILSVSVMATTMCAAPMGGCEALSGQPKEVAAEDKFADVKIKSERFKLEVAADNAVRTKGLGGRTEIAADGGMLFAFPPPYRVLEFVMRDCPINIDIIYTDGVGRVLATHTMLAEAPRGPGEGQPGTFDNASYELRLKRYSSRFPATFAIELKEGTITRLGVKEGDVIEFDHKGVKKRAR